MAPSDWPGLCQKAKFKDIPPSVRAFDGGAGMHAWNCLWVAAPSPGCGSHGALHPPCLFANSSLSVPLREPATHSLLSQGAAPVPRFSLLTPWFTCVSNITSFYFKLLIAHLLSPSSIPQFLEDKAHSVQDREGRSGCGEVWEAGTWVGRQAGSQVLMLRHSWDTLAQL